MDPGRPTIRLVEPPTEAPAVDKSVHRVKLVRDAQRGDVAAFERLARDHYQQLYSFAMSFAGGPAEAADVAQEALVKAYRKIGSYRFASSFSTWLLQIARNTFRDRLRQKQLAQAKLERFADLESRVEPATPEQELARKQLRQVIDRALQRIDPRFREVVLLFDLEGLDYKEIAEVCDLPMGTVKSRLRRGRDALCKALIQEGVIRPGHRPAADPDAEENEP